MIPQVAHGAYLKQLAKPIVISEPWYEFIPGYASAMDIRLAFWGSFLSGAAGITYGGGHVWWAYLPDNHEKPDKSMGAYPIDPDLKANALDYPGAQSVGFMAHYLAGILGGNWSLIPNASSIILPNSVRLFREKSVSFICSMAAISVLTCAQPAIKRFTIGGRT